MDAALTTFLDVSGLRSLAGVVMIEDVTQAEPAMRVTFADGLIVTVMRSGINKSHFDIWFPSTRPLMAGEVSPNHSVESVLKNLKELARKASN